MNITTSALGRAVPLTLTVAASVLLVVGTFCPFSALSESTFLGILGGHSTSVSTLWDQSASPEAAIAIVTAAAGSCVLAVFGRFEALFPLSIMCLALTVYEMAKVQAESKVISGIFLIGGLVSVHREWAWIPLLVGSLLLLLAPIVRFTPTERIIESWRGDGAPPSGADSHIASPAALSGSRGR